MAELRFVLGGASLAPRGTIGHHPSVTTSRRIRIRERLQERLGRPPELRSPAECWTILEGGSSSWRIRALTCLALGRTGTVDLPRFRALLDDPVPGIRRVAAWALGLHADPESLTPLRAAAGRERCFHPRLAQLAAARRCGMAEREALAILRRGGQVWAWTVGGARDLGPVSAPPIAVQERLLGGASGGGDPAGERARLPASLEATPGVGELLISLALLQHPGDLERLRGRRGSAGRREAHLLSEALGLLGDVRARSDLVGIIEAMDVDPGHGFRGRRIAAEALGALGDPAAGPYLVRALESEALDFEGRPGAGLGIQFPVRSALLGALGECGAQAAGPVLATYLGNTHGSALGGFYLPAMAALIKLGASDVVRPFLRYEETVAVHAVGVAGALGDLNTLWLASQDPRATVAAAARAARSLYESVVDIVVPETRPPYSEV